MKNKKLIAIIPARGGSKRIPQKNIKEFFGHPLIAYTITAAITSNLFSKVVVSTDCPETGKIAQWYGAEYLPRPKSLATDTAGLVEVALHVLSSLEENNIQIDALCQLMPNCPLRRSSDIVNHYSIFKINQHLFQISTVSYRGVYPHWALVEDSEGYGQWLFSENNLIPSQKLRKAFCPTGAIWWARASDFKKQRAFYGDPFHLCLMDANRGIDIDNLEDLELAELLVRGLLARDSFSPLEPISRKSFLEED